MYTIQDHTAIASTMPSQELIRYAAIGGVLVIGSFVMFKIYQKKYCDPSRQTIEVPRSVTKVTNNTKYEIRMLQKSDYEKGYIDLLSQLTEVGNVSKEEFNIAFDNMSSKKTVFVIESDDPDHDDPDHDSGSNENKSIIIATLAVVMEQKFIHNCRRVGHIEDLVIDKRFRGQGLAKLLMLHVSEFGEKNNAYKSILDCHVKNAGLYKKCGFDEKEIQMVRYY